MNDHRRALIGYSGFVGSNLYGTGRFTDVFNSVSSARMAGQRFDRIVCAGVSAAKWIANRDPEGDWAAISRLIAVLERVEADQFVLISTIDVYDDPASGSDEESPIDGERNHAYGRNRLRLEKWVTGHFARSYVVRLPGLFGPGLRKNAIYDLLHDNQAENINPRAIYQWYPVARLSGDIQRTLEADIRVVNLFTEPLAMSAVIERCFNGARVGQSHAPAAAYNLRTRHAALFGGHDGYILDAPQVLDEMSQFVAVEQGRAR